MCTLFTKHDENDELLEKRRFDDGPNIINDVLLYLMSCKYAITGLIDHGVEEWWEVVLYMQHYEEIDLKKKPWLDPNRHYAMIEIWSEGCMLYVYEHAEFKDPN